MNNTAWALPLTEFITLSLIQFVRGPVKVRGLFQNSITSQINTLFQGSAESILYKACCLCWITGLPVKPKVKCLYRQFQKP